MEYIVDEEPLMGFVDESSLRLNPNKCRVVNTDYVTYSEDESRSKTVFGFVVPDGNDVVMLSDKSKADDMVSFLELIRKENPARHICIVLDNARIHHATSVAEKVKELKIEFIYLPPYSPDLNPIEFGWKDMKRELATLLDFNLMVQNSRQKALELFHQRKRSYSRYWVQTFMAESIVPIEIKS